MARPDFLMDVAYDGECQTYLDFLNCITKLGFNEIFDFFYYQLFHSEHLMLRQKITVLYILVNYSSYLDNSKIHSVLLGIIDPVVSSVSEEDLFVFEASNLFVGKYDLQVSLQAWVLIDDPPGFFTKALKLKMQKEMAYLELTSSSRSSYNDGNQFLLHLNGG